MKSFAIRPPRHSDEILIERDVIIPPHVYPQRIRRYAKKNKSKAFKAEGWTVFYAAGTGWHQQPLTP